jgi:hypothetical protein
MRRLLTAAALSLALAGPAPGDTAPASAPVWVMVHHQVADLAAWRAAFDAALPTRRAAGELSHRVATTPSYPGAVTVVFRWDDAARARAFLADPFVLSGMRAAGVTSAPVVTYRPAGAGG